MTMNREVAIGALVMLLLGASVARIAMPNHERMRRVGVEGLEIKSEEVKSGTVFDKSVDWIPPTDVLVVGWIYQLGSTAGTLYLQQGQTVIMSASPKHPTENPAEVPGGGFLIQKNGTPLSLRFVIPNEGPDGRSGETWARIYFVAAEGN